MLTETEAIFNVIIDDQYQLPEVRRKKITVEDVLNEESNRDAYLIRAEMKRADQMIKDIELNFKLNYALRMSSRD